MNRADFPAPEAITLRIATVRGQRVLLDADLAALYDVETKRFNEAVKRNMNKFPSDFMFQLSADEWQALRSQSATLDITFDGRGKHRKYLPYAFTEHGAIMAANLLSSARAVEVAVFVVRAFVQLREWAATHADLARRLEELEEKTEGLEQSHGQFRHNTRLQLKQVIETLRELMTPPDPPKRPIGFVTHDDKDKSQQDAQNTSSW
ncbi:ORF6N domain-containing protein [Roseateles amylovorans]|jgi:phage regulator Rha-like protein|uniref:ORF6N domain-containing protein n=1 Tax=Roseateles amylovorans TaxID=2978473 RepID=A0ABY6AYG7_9BURK|nr:ORF6N domain-containing protein [Roseateles amylovorans]UXH78224.1 ORF6N domain-containing protein [Roseateles amylovorans]